VYRARQRRPDRLVAIKVVTPELAADPEFRARFERESATTAEIEHPNVIPVYEVGEDRGLLFIVMRFVPGTDLGQLAGRGQQLDPARAARLVFQVAEALDVAHARGLVHRDVKPENVLVTERDHVYLMDFGLTKRMSDSRGMTQAGMFVGTVDYIAPEQVEGRPLDARADVYALGCVTYELLSGEVPFPRDSDVAKILAHVNDPPPVLRGVPEPLAAAVQQAMAKRPEDRFSSAGDLGLAVVAGVQGRVHERDRAVATGPAAPRDALTEAAHVPEPPSAGQPPASPPPRSRRRAILLGLVALLAAGGVAAGLVLALTGSSQPPSAAHVTAEHFLACVETKSDGAIAVNAQDVDPLSRQAIALGGPKSAFGLRLPSGDDVDISVWPTAEKAQEIRDLYYRSYLELVTASRESAISQLHFGITDQVGTVVMSYDKPAHRADRALLRSCAA